MTKKHIILGFIIALFTITSVITAQDDITIFPELTGTYQVGRTTVDMRDDSRQEIFTSDDSDIRAFNVTLFYPATPTDEANPAPYIPETILTPLSQEMGIPASFFEGFQPHSYQNAPIADGEFPVILFSHGLGTALQLYTGQLEDLASHGYIVVAMSHTYTTPVVALSDGRVLRMSEGDSSPLLDATQSLDELNIALEEIVFPVWHDDMLFVLNQLDALNADSILAGHMDVSRIGAFGHSFGGAISLESAFQDDRILGAINMDGAMFGEVVEQGLTIPAMIMRSDATRIDDPQFDAVMAQMDTDQNTVLSTANLGYLMIMPNAAHNTYATDYLVFADAYPEFIPADLVGEVDIMSARATIHQTVLAFMNTYVAGEGSPQMSDLSFDNVDLTIFNGE